MKAFENHQRANGQNVSHGTAKEILAGFAVFTPVTEQFLIDFRVSLLTVLLKTRVSIGLTSKYPSSTYANWGREKVRLFWKANSNM